MNPKHQKRLPQFYFDDSEDSRKAKELLDRHGIQCDVHKHSNPPPEEVSDDDLIAPAILSGDGWFQGLGGIKSYIELVCDLDKAL